MFILRTLERVEGAGFSIYYAPESGNGLHCRLVWKEHENGLVEYPSEDCVKQLGRFLVKDTNI